MSFFKKQKQKKFFVRLPKPGFRLGRETKQGIFIIILILAAFISALSFLGRAGEAGIYINNYLEYILGNGKWALPIILSLISLSITSYKDKNFDSANIIGLFLFLMSSSSLLYFYSSPTGAGILGVKTVEWLMPSVGPLIAAVLFSCGLIVSLLLILDTSLEKLLGAESPVFKIMIFIPAMLISPFIRKDLREADDEEEAYDDNPAEEVWHEPATGKGRPMIKDYDIEEEYEKGEARGHDNSAEEKKPENDFSWSKSNIKMNIPLDLLKSKPKKPTSGNIERNQDVIRKTLEDFGIGVDMGQVSIGPTVTQYTFKPANGISVARVKALSDDLALNLALHPVRIEAPIPGRALVGLEVPNQIKVRVALKEILQSKKFHNRTSNMLVPLGRDVTGRIWLDDLAKMPHLLVAGATGSGKSVCLHSLIISLLYQNDPDDLKMILIDAKQVEFNVYEDLPYLITPVITDNKRAIRALQWCLTEMDRRLSRLKEAGSINIEDYNKKQAQRLPYLVVVIDELGDLLSTARKEAEAAIIRLGQKARAAGIHLVLATQRPTVDILSGLIKANLPARMAFSVTSSINSKTILDFIGAEKLLGQGDMLYINSQIPKPVRIQASYIGKDEITAVVNYTKKRAGQTNYVEDITEVKINQYNHEPDEVDDTLLLEAKKLIVDSGRASTSMLQSRLAIGYPRANRILDILEKQGLVGPSIQNKPREVFISQA